jgi:hypothetical protein
MLVGLLLIVMCVYGLKFFFVIVLHEILERLRVEQNAESLTEVIKDLHLYPDYHGLQFPSNNPRW